MPAEGTPAAVRDHVDAGRETIRSSSRSWSHGGSRLAAARRSRSRALGAQSLVALGEHLARLTLTRPQEYTPERAGKFVRTLLGALAA